MNKNLVGAQAQGYKRAADTLAGVMLLEHLSGGARPVPEVSAGCGRFL
jgi:hypothetical protein